MILLSIIIPCFNSERYLYECLESVTNQNLEEIEIICINDGSTDSTQSLLEKWKAKDKRINIISQENKGVSAARNIGIHKAKGNYIYFLDSDDFIFDKNVFFKYKDILKFKKIDIIVGAAKTFYENNELAEQFPEFINRYQIKHTYNDSLSGPEAILKLRQGKDWSVTPGTRIYRRLFLLENKIDFIEGYLHEDGLFTYKSLLLSNYVKIVNDTFYYRRIHSDSIMTKKLSYINVLSYIVIFRESLLFAESIHKKHSLDPIIDASVTVAKNMAIRTYNKLDQDEKNLLIKKMNSEQRFYFEAFIKREAQLTQENKCITL